MHCCDGHGVTMYNMLVKVVGYVNNRSRCRDPRCSVQLRPVAGKMGTHTSFDWEWDIEQTAQFATTNGYRNIALQFPDELLQYSTTVASLLKQRLGSSYTVAVLADTAFNPEAVDEVAARHVNASCVVHYGHASLAAVSQLPVLYVFPRQHVHVRHTATAVAGALRGSSSSSGSDSQGTAVVILDQALLHARGAFESALHELMIPHSWQVVMAGLSVQSSQQGQLASSQPPQPTTCTSSTGACSTAGITAAPAAVSTLPVTQTVQTSGRCCGATGGPCTAGSGSCSTTDTQGAGSTVPCATVQPALPDVACSTSKQQQQGVAGYTWSLPEGTQPESVVYVWVGPQDCITLQALQLTLNMGRWLSITPAATAEQGAHKGSSSSSTEAVQEGSTDGQDTGPAGVCCVQEGLVQGTQALLRRRYFLVEKAKDASIVGILVGTLAVAGLTPAMSELRRLIKEAGKKSYTMLMGKPNPAKLANFPEVEVWVQLADPLGFILDSKPYMAPIITPFEAVLAFTGGSLLPGTVYRLGLEPLLESAAQAGSTGGTAGVEEGEDGETSSSALVASRMAGLTVSNAGGAGTLSMQGGARGGAMVKARDGAEFLALHRTYKGLEAPVAGAEYKAPAAAVEGLAGRAACYAQEPPVPAEKREW